jgi:hypothetical protein
MLLPSTLALPKPDTLVTLMLLDQLIPQWVVLPGCVRHILVYKLTIWIIWIILLVMGSMVMVVLVGLNLRMVTIVV